MGDDGDTTLRTCDPLGRAVEVQVQVPPQIMDGLAGAHLSSRNFPEFQFPPV